jgi:hypothetical protein
MWNIQGALAPMFIQAASFATLSRKRFIYQAHSTIEAVLKILDIMIIGGFLNNSMDGDHPPIPSNEFIFQKFF